jgi:hypothetical protein
VHSGLFHVLHDPADDHLAGVVTQRVDVDLGGVLEEAVDQHGTLGGEATFSPEGAEAGQFLHGPSQALVVVDDLHGPAAEHVGGPHQHRVAHALADGERSVDVGRGAPAGWGISRRAHRAFHCSRSSARSIEVGLVPATRPGRCRPGELERGLTPERDDDPDRLLGLDDVLDVLVGERLEVEAVAGVVVGRHRLGVAVDHDRLVAGVAQGERWRARSSSRTRCPARCGSGPIPG